MYDYTFVSLQGWRSLHGGRIYHTVSAQLSATATKEKGTVKDGEWVRRGGGKERYIQKRREDRQIKKLRNRIRYWKK